ncbi:MAG: 6,7-dimethyl-8-ribityllumazine synthase [Candidatus ainarchaeum sp.]|nr:6,7-dimethyl-8-ribityllumazine synthase [Candidatus ainarchaeum sp.]
MRQGKEDEGEVTPNKEKKIKLAFVVCEFNSQITKEMEKFAIEHINSQTIINTNNITIIRVPGAYDVPLAAKKLLYDKTNDGVVVLGAIIKGDTLHDEVIGHSTAQALIKLSLEFNKPIALGIIGPGATEEQAEARKKEYAERAVDAAIKLIQSLKK